MILRSEDDEEIDIVAEPDEEQSAQQQFIAFQHHQQQHNSKMSRADCMKKLQTSIEADSLASLVSQRLDLELLMREILALEQRLSQLTPDSPDYTDGKLTP